MARVHDPYATAEFYDANPQLDPLAQVKQYMEACVHRVLKKQLAYIPARQAGKGAEWLEDNAAPIYQRAVETYNVRKETADFLGVPICIRVHCAALVRMFTSRGSFEDDVRLAFTGSRWLHDASLAMFAHLQEFKTGPVGREVQMFTGDSSHVYTFMTTLWNSWTGLGAERTRRYRTSTRLQAERTERTNDLLTALVSAWTPKMQAGVPQACPPAAVRQPAAAVPARKKARNE